MKQLAQCHSIHNVHLLFLLSCEIVVGYSLSIKVVCVFAEVLIVGNSRLALIEFITPFRYVVSES